MNTHQGSEERQRVNAWLAAMGRATGLRLALNEQGLCAVGHASGLDCAIEVPDGSGTVFLRSPLMDWHDGAVPGLAEFCLSEHFLGQGTHGASFAIDREEAMLVLWLFSPLAALDEQSFGGWIAQFLDSAAQCRQRLDAFCRNAASSNPAGSPPTIQIDVA